MFRFITFSLPSRQGKGFVGRYGLKIVIPRQEVRSPGCYEVTQVEDKGRYFLASIVVKVEEKTLGSYGEGQLGFQVRRVSPDPSHDCYFVWADMRLLPDEEAKALEMSAYEKGPMWVVWGKCFETYEEASSFFEYLKMHFKEVLKVHFKETS